MANVESLSEQYSGYISPLEAEEIHGIAQDAGVTYHPRQVEEHGASHIPVAASHV